MAAVSEIVTDQLVWQISAKKETNQQSGSFNSVSNDAYTVECANCDQMFSPDCFEEHVCEFDDERKRIASTNALESHPCFKQIEENIEQWRRLTRKGKAESDAERRNRRSAVGNCLRETHDCLYCERKFVHASGLSRHISNCHPEKLDTTSKRPAISTKAASEPFKVGMKCVHCGMIFGTVDKMMEHFEQVDWEYDLEQFDGFHMMDGKLSLRKAIRIVILTSVYQCEFCENHFADLPSLYQHESLHDPALGFECSLCEITIPSIRDALYHRLNECVFRVTSNEEFQNLPKHFVCNVCDEMFASLAVLYEHRYGNYHLFPRVTKPKDDSTDISKIACELCGITFDNADSIIIHHNESHVAKRATTLGLRRNLAEKPSEVSPNSPPSSARPYLCEMCGKTYTQSSHLWQHLRFHNGIRPFSCKEEGCNRSFTIRPDLKDHIRKCHTGERPYHCELCDKRFLTGSVYYQHRLIHRGERRYGCDECGKRFYRADALKNHQRIHSGEKPYSCSFCEKHFRQRGDREKHIRVKHSNLEKNKEKKPVSVRDGRENSKQRRFKKQHAIMERNHPEPVSVMLVDEASFPASLFQPILNDIDVL